MPGLAISLTTLSLDLVAAWARVVVGLVRAPPGSVTAGRLRFDGMDPMALAPRSA